MTQDEIISEFKANCEKYQEGGEVHNKGGIIGILTKACGNSENRHLVLRVLTGKFSSKLLSEPEWYGLLCLVQPEKPVGGHWQSKRGDYELKQMCGELLRRSVSQPGQMEMPL